MSHKEKSGLATAGMVLGIIGIVLSLIQIINNIAFVLGALAFIFGAVGILQTKNNKKSGRGKAIAAVVLAILTIALVLVSQSIFGKALDEVTGEGEKVGESKPASSKAEKTTFKVGDVISFDGKKVTVSKVERNWNSGDEFTTPESGNEFVKVQVKIENNSSEDVSYNTFDWKLKDSKGVIKDVDSAAFGIDGALDSGDIAPKGKVSGFLIFQAPAGDTNLALRYEPSFWSDKKVEVKL